MTEIKTILPELTIALYALLHLCEAWLEKIVIDLKNGNLPNYILLNRKEHFRSAVWSAILLLLISVILVSYESYFLLIAALFTRRIYFDFPLILFRQRRNPSIYEGNDWWVNNIFKPIFGRRGRVKELLVTGAIWIAAIVFHFLNK